MNLAIIPARKGSKRILKKNIKNFFGKPVIYNSIKQAKLTKLFDKIIVSTDCKKIQKIAKEYGAEASFLRPKNLSNDYVQISEVVKHSITYFVKKKIYFNYVCCIFPVAPFLEKKDIIKGYKEIKKNKWSFVFSAVKNSYPYYRGFKKHKENGIKMIFPQNYKKRTQDLPETFFDAGQFYWGLSKAWLKQKKVFDKNSTIVEIPKWKSIDIDTISDWKYAEMMMKIKKK